MNYELIELTINFENKESEYIIVSLDSTAHQLVRDYVKANGYELIEKPFLTDWEKNALEVALDSLIESIECDADEYQVAEKLKAVKSVREKLA